MMEPGVPASEKPVVYRRKVIKDTDKVAYIEPVPVRLYKST